MGKGMIGGNEVGMPVDTKEIIDDAIRDALGGGEIGFGVTSKDTEPPAEEINVENVECKIKEWRFARAELKRPNLSDKEREDNSAIEQRASAFLRQKTEDGLMAVMLAMGGDEQLSRDELRSMGLMK
jgi:hypothetical protein